MKKNVLRLFWFYILFSLEILDNKNNYIRKTSLLFKAIISQHFTGGVLFQDTFESIKQTEDAMLPLGCHLFN